MGRQNERTLGPFGKVRYFIIEKENWGISIFFRPTGQKQTQNRQTKIGMIIRFPLIDIYRWERDERETQTEMETQRTKRETNWKRDKRQRWRRWTEGSVGSWGRHRFWSKSSSQNGSQNGEGNDSFLIKTAYNPWEGLYRLHRLLFDRQLRLFLVANNLCQKP